MLLKIFMFVVTTLLTTSSTPVTFAGINCQQYDAPLHGQITCESRANVNDVFCTMTCNSGYDVEFLASEEYVCHGNGQWSTLPVNQTIPWPNCRIYGRGDPIP